MKELTQANLKEHLLYDDTTGIFTRLQQSCNSVVVGELAGFTNKHTGYHLIRVLGKEYQAHRLAWLYVNGYLPSKDIDHINGVKNDNRICNLREASRSENLQNCGKRKDNASGVKGVNWHKMSGKWRAQIRHNGKKIHIGLFDSIEKAEKAMKEKREQLHTEFAHHG